MNAPDPPPRRAKPGSQLALTGICVAIYISSLGWLATTMSSSETQSARDFVAQLASRPSMPPRPLPALPTLALPDLAMQRDPFAALPRGPRQAQPATAPPHQQFQFIAMYVDLTEPHVLARDADGRLAQFHTGDTVNGSLIVRIDADAVVLDSAGHATTVRIARPDVPATD